MAEIVVSLSVEYLVAREVYGYVRNSYVTTVIRTGQRKVKDIEISVKYVIECFVAVLHVCRRTVPFESPKQPSFVVFIIRLVRRSFGLTFAPVRPSRGSIRS